MTALTENDNIIGILVFPLDEYFRLLVSIFFCLGWVFFFVDFRHRFQIYRGSSAARRGARRALGAPLRAPFGASRLSPPSAPPLGPGGLLAVPPTTPGKFETDGESQKKNISQEKKNITKNENMIQRKHQYPYNINVIYFSDSSFVPLLQTWLIELLNIMSILSW